MIKKIYILLLTVLGMGVISSCSDYLNSEKYFKDRLTLEKTFESKDHVEEWLAYAFSFIKNENYEVTTKGPSENSFCFSDDMYYGDRDKTIDATKNELSYNMFKLGEYDENTYNVGAWGACYKGIFQASVFIHNVDRCQEMADWEILDYKGQARFVRAYYYWLLLRKYGPVPLLPDEGLDYTSDYDDLAIQRSSYDECVEYIESEMRLAAKDLPLTRAINQVARPTRGAALAARARALIYSASPINNPRPGDPDKFSDLVDYEGNCLMSQEYNEYKWARAAAAARDVMELPGENNGHRYELYHKKATNIAEPGYPATITPYQDGDFSTKTWNEGGYSDIDPYESYRAVFNGSLAMYQNPELIFSRGRNQGVNSIAEMVKLQMPKTLGGGSNAYGMTQKMCDAYYMANGDEFSREHFKEEYPYGTRFVTKEEVEAGTYPQLKEGVYKEYANREPRFYASVAFSGAFWPFASAKDAEYRNQQIWYYRGNKEGRKNGSDKWIPTGIGMMKFINPNDCNTNNGKIYDKVDVAIRYADILLMYAEALNELTPGNSYEVTNWQGETMVVSRNTEEMSKSVSRVRIRAGMPDYEQEVYNDQTLFRKKLMHERQVEFMGENQRYHDLRRWKNVAIEESEQIYGCNVLMTEATKERFYERVRVENLQANFSRKMYFWPILERELQWNRRMTQAPGWETFD